MTKKEEDQIEHISESESEEEKNFDEIHENLKGVDNEQVRKILGASIKKLQSKIVRKRESRISKLKSKLENFSRRHESPEYLVKRDEIIYSVVLTSFLFTFGLLFYPITNVKFIFILGKLFVLYIFRFFDFRQRKWHYYLFEYCYFVSLLMFISLIYGRHNKLLLTTFFTNALGPVAVSFFVLRYTIAWHDLTTYTSFFMHIAPGLVAWIMRFHVVEEGFLLLEMNGTNGSLKWDGLDIGKFVAWVCCFT